MESTNKVKIKRKETSNCKTGIQKLKTKAKKEIKYLAYVNGPILFTAPHSCRVYRGGPEYGRKETIHLREKYTSILAMRWASQSKNSFCVWAKGNKLNRKITDPNYIQESKKASSPFHQALHALQMKDAKGDFPLMHVDVHGKKNRESTFELDLGIVSLFVKWEGIDYEFCNAFTKTLTENFNEALSLAKPYKGIKAVCNNEPILHGYWGEDNIFTMTEQAVDLGIPSFQLEIPFEMRQQLFTNKDFSDAFLKAITDSYEAIVKPWWPRKKIKQTCNIEIASRLKQIDDNQSENTFETLVNEYEKWEADPSKGKTI